MKNINNITDKISSDYQKIRLLAVINSPFTNTFDSLYAACKESKDFEFLFIVIPNHDSRQDIALNEISEFLENKGYAYIEGYNELTKEYLDPKSLNPDVVFLQLPYDVFYKTNLYSINYLSKFSRVVHISYGGTIVNYNVSPYRETIFSRANFFEKSWFIAVENRDIAKTLNKFFPHKFVPLGYLKCDNYISSLPSYKKENGIKTIAWKPRWLLYEEHSSFLKYIEHIILYFETHKDLSLLYIEHPLTRNQSKKTGLMSTDAYDELIERINALGNSRIVKDGDFLDEIMNADIYIGDYSSTILEFSLTGKPVIYTSNTISLNIFGKKIIKTWYCEENWDDIVKRLEDLLNGVDPYKKKRKQFIPQITYMPKNNNTLAHNMLAYMKKRIEKENHYSSNKHKIYIRIRRRVLLMMYAIKLFLSAVPGFDLFFKRKIILSEIKTLLYK